MEFYSGFFSSYNRTSEPTNFPIVVHAVAGSGKTTIIRNILQAHPTLTAVTFGTPDPINLAGRRIAPPTTPADIVDEYLAGPTQPSAKLLLADPLQHRADPLRAHFTCNRTQRFGRDTCKLLNSLGVDVLSDKEDEVTYADAYIAEPEGTIIALGEDSAQLLSDHSVEFLLPCQALGLTFDVVTVLTDAPLEEQDFTSRYIACSRHRKKLLILH